MENIEDNDTLENDDQELEISPFSDGFVFHPDIEEDAELSQKLFRQLLRGGLKSYGRAAG